MKQPALRSLSKLAKGTRPNRQRGLLTPRSLQLDDPRQNSQQVFWSHFALSLNRPSGAKRVNG